MKHPTRLAATLLTALLAGPTSADSLPQPATEKGWTDTLALPEYKGPDPCAGHTKGVCTADDYHPRAQALVRFRLDSDAIDPDFNRPLDELGRALQNGLADAVLTIHGHADSSGSDGHNRKLSQRRADAVCAYLAKHFAIDAERLRPQAHGEADPSAANDTEAGRRQNRRVEFERIGVWIR